MRILFGLRSLHVCVCWEGGTVVMYMVNNVNMLWNLNMSIILYVFIIILCHCRALVNNLPTDNATVVKVV